jgi:hypothetical protein
MEKYNISGSVSGPEDLVTRWKQELGSRMTPAIYVGKPGDPPVERVPELIESGRFASSERSPFSTRAWRRTIRRSSPIGRWRKSSTFQWAFTSVPDPPGGLFVWLGRAALVGLRRA